MKGTTLVMSAGLALAMMTLAGTAAASDTGAGVCVAGVGASVNDPTMDGPYVGVNAGVNSESGIFLGEEGFMRACCAETGSPPDCFRPVE